MSIELAAEVTQLSNQKTELAARKVEICNQLSQLRNRVRVSGRMKNGDYQFVCQEQNNLKDELTEIEIQIGKTKMRLREIAEINQTRWAKRNDEIETPKSIIMELAAIREHYQKFSADATRVSSMRTMAADFAIKIDGVIKRAINKTH